jgi:PAS domain S-box-containing protein
VAGKRRTKRGHTPPADNRAADLPSAGSADDIFRLAVESSPSGMIMAKPDGSIVMANAEAVRMFGYSREEMLALSIDALVPDNVRPNHANLRAAFMKDPRARRMGENRELSGRRKDGSLFPVEVGLNPIRTADGMLVLSAIVDVTTRKAADEKFRLAVESSPNGMIMADADGSIVLANAEAGRMFGYTREEMLSLNVDALVPSRVRPGHAGLRAGFLKNPRARRMGEGRDLSAVRKDGSEFPVEVGLTPIDSAQGMMVMIAVVDLSAGKLLTEQLQQAQKMEAVGLLAGGVAHDFNNLLTVFFAYSGMLLEVLPKDEQPYQWVREIQHASERARDLTTHLLTLSSRRKIQPAKTDLCAAVFEMQKMLRRLLPSSLELEVITDPRPCWVFVDVSQMGQVVLNLAVNARDAMPDGGRISIAVKRRTRDGLDTVELTVADTGVGMSPETIAHIFEPFFTTKEPGRGTGLGLAICYGIVSQAGGKISVQSTLGKGSAFTISLPRVAAPEEEKAAGSWADSAASTTGTETILVVDDSRQVLEAARQILVSAGYTVHTANNGDEALRTLKAKEGSFALVLSDIVMPQMSGRELLERVVVLWPQLPVVLMTGYADPRVVTDASALAAAALIEKPFQPALLQATVRRVLDRKPGSA